MYKLNVLSWTYTRIAFTNPVETRWRKCVVQNVTQLLLLRHLQSLLRRLRSFINPMLFPIDVWPSSSSEVYYKYMNVSYTVNADQPFKFRLCFVLLWWTAAPQPTACFWLEACIPKTTAPPSGCEEEHTSAKCTSFVRRGDKQVF